jgi:hypothetical protein
MSTAWDPDMRTTANPPSPSGVAIAAIVSSIMRVGRNRVDVAVVFLSFIEDAPGQWTRPTSQGTGGRLDVATIGLSIFGFTTLQEEHGFLITFLVQVVQKNGIGVSGEFRGHRVQLKKDGSQVRFRTDSSKTLHSLFQLHEFI